MQDNPTGADDYRILVYARLIDPEIWPQDEDPEVSVATTPRLRRSIEAAYRIAAHHGDLVDHGDIVGRLCVALGLDDAPSPIALADGISPEDAAGLVALLMGDIPTGMPDVGARSGTADHPPHDVDRDVDQDVDGDDDTAEVDGATPDDEDDFADPDHDPETGISHVGDADEGQYHEEL